ncbi:NAD-dependent epimerase/dehydratase family protein [Fundicoccus sp. Sow4_D5]|uniref:NAD-dependent epimerase/dehydratase family protein n=1 Tax=Fundicoccus sp. Sow4_D5 TaxID=3438782 RepID=UPI003F8E3C16
MKKILVLGGTNFFGKKAVQLLLDKGYDVTLATRGNKANPFEGKAAHILLDASEPEHAGWQRVKAENWDAVFDNICYDASDAHIRIDKFGKQLEHYYFTSSLAVYDGAKDGFVEADFDPTAYHIDPEKQVDYGEGKRQAEQVLFTKAPFKVTAFRFPIVLDEDDYTKRLHLYVEKALNNDTIQFNNPEAKINFVKGSSAANAIVWVIENQQTGSLNISSRDSISRQTFIEWLQEMTGQTVKVDYTQETITGSPFNTRENWYLISDKIEAAGFGLDELESWLKPLIRTLATEMKASQ